jgi:hypothetical protein
MCSAIYVMAPPVLSAEAQAPDQTQREQQDRRREANPDEGGRNAHAAQGDHGRVLAPESPSHQDRGQTSGDVEVVPLNDIPHPGGDDHAAEFLERQFRCRHRVPLDGLDEVSSDPDPLSRRWALNLANPRQTPAAGLLLSNPLDDGFLRRRWRHHVRRQTQLEADEMSEAGFGAARQNQSIEEEEQTLVLKDLAGQKTIDLAM